MSPNTRSVQWPHQWELGPLFTSFYCRFLYKQGTIRHRIFRKIETKRRRCADFIGSDSNVTTPTQVHWKYMPLNTFLQHRYYIPYCTFRGSFKVKRPVSGAKTRVQYVTLACFCYIDIGRYCCVSIMLLQVRIAVVHNSNIWGMSLYVNATKPNPKPTRLGHFWIVNKFKVDIKKWFLNS